jgi:hypothetical protein
MKILCIVAAFCLIAVSVSADDILAPGMSAGGGWVDYVTDCPGMVKYSQTPEWINGGASQDEVQADPDNCGTGVAAEVADDFEFAGAPITAVRFWNITNGNPYGDDLIWRITIWADNGTCPAEDAFYCQYKAPSKNVEVQGYPGLPSYEHCVILPEPCPQEGGIAWFSPVAIYCRATSNGYGQAFVEMHTNYVGNEICFRSAFFGYPTWVPGSNVFGDFFDHGFELLYTDDVPVEPSSWGTLKDLYR